MTDIKSDTQLLITILEDFKKRYGLKMLIKLIVNWLDLVLDIQADCDKIDL
jgi:hypothetical protein